MIGEELDPCRGLGAFRHILAGGQEAAVAGRPERHPYLVAIDQGLLQLGFHARIRELQPFLDRILRKHGTGTKKLLEADPRQHRRLRDDKDLALPPVADHEPLVCSEQGKAIGHVVECHAEAQVLRLQVADRMSERRIDLLKFGCHQPRRLFGPPAIPVRIGVGADDQFAQPHEIRGAAADRGTRQLPAEKPLSGTGHFSRSAARVISAAPQDGSSQPLRSTGHLSRSAARVMPPRPAASPPSSGSAASTGPRGGPARSRHVNRSRSG